jgi:hypothetical protein
LFKRPKLILSCSAEGKGGRLQTQRELSVYGYVIERVDRANGYGGIAVGLEIASITYYLTYIPPRTQLLINFFHQQSSTCARAA